MPDFYELLQVDPRADPEVIRAAYRVLARKYHPDHGGDPLRMIELNNAWDVLGDPARRAAYDASRASPANRQSVETVARPDAGAQRTPDSSHAGPPPGRPSGTVLDFGRYAGWSLGEIARQDTDYLEWLQRATFGRRLRSEITALLAQRRSPGVAGRAPSGGGWKGRL
jgi:curved DNA-binding protein CbpA